MKRTKPENAMKRAITPEDAMKRTTKPTDLLPTITEHDDRLWTTSLEVAEKFGKRHKDVLRAYQNAIKDLPEDFGRRNFAPSSYKNSQGKEQPMVEMTRGGFSFIAMGFTGKNAAHWKVQFITAFDAMEQHILVESKKAKRQGRLEWKKMREQGKSVRLLETDTIKDFADYATAQGSKNAQRYYVNITKMVYKALFLVEQGAGPVRGIRELLEIEQLSYLLTAEVIATKALKEGMQDQLDYKDIYLLAKERVERFAEAVGVTTPRLPE